MHALHRCALRRLNGLAYSSLATAGLAFDPKLNDEVPASALHPYERSDMSPIRVVRKKGADVIKDPLFNKGTAFPAAERERLGIRGLLPPRILSIEEQELRVLSDYYEGLDYVSPEEVENWNITRCGGEGRKGFEPRARPGAKAEQADWLRAV